MPRNRNKFFITLYTYVKVQSDYNFGALWNSSNSIQSKSFHYKNGFDMNERNEKSWKVVFFMLNFKSRKEVNDLQLITDLQMEKKMYTFLFLFLMIIWSQNLGRKYHFPFILRCCKSPVKKVAIYWWVRGGWNGRTVLNETIKTYYNSQLYLRECHWSKKHLIFMFGRSHIA